MYYIIIISRDKVVLTLPNSKNFKISYSLYDHNVE